MGKSVPWTTLLFAIALTHCPAQQPSISAAVSSRPQEAGAYYYAAQKWEPLSHVLNSGRKPRHVYRLIVPSFVPEVVLIFRGTEAPVKIIERNPLFFIRPSATGGKFPGGLSRDVLLVRLEKKKDHRELPVTSGASVFNMAQNIPKKQIIKSAVVVESENAFTLRPTEDLPPGEYMITFGTGQLGGYDFEIANTTLTSQTTDHKK